MKKLAISEYFSSYSGIAIIICAFKVESLHGKYNRSMTGDIALGEAG